MEPSLLFGPNSSSRWISLGLLRAPTSSAMRKKCRRDFRSSSRFARIREVTMRASWNWKRTVEFGPDAAMPISIPSVCVLMMSENDAVAREKDAFSRSLYVDELRQIWFCLGVK